MGFYDRYILPRVLDLAMRRASLVPQREWVFQQVRGQVLEVGFGSGVNLRYYPRDIRTLTAVEPSARMRSRALKRIATSGKTVSLVASGMDKRLPLPSGSFDTILSTWTLCTIADPVAAMKEVNRLLKPGGRYIFVEHGIAPDPEVIVRQQKLTKYTEKWGGGCHLDRDIEAIVRRSKLAFGKIEKFYLPDAMRVAGFTYRGVGIKDS